ncbi:MAG: sulfotransferase family protein [Actinomycetota bacterium]
MPPQLPTFAIIGAMKSGTSTIAMMLDQHPDAYLVPNKEVYFFDREDVYARGVDWYRERFQDSSGQRAVGEASPSYLFVPAAIERMLAVIPDAKLIAILREPVSRAYSHFGHERFYARESRSFERAVDEELSGAPNGGAPFWYVDRGRYLPQLLRVCERFPRAQLLVLLMDDLMRDPGGTATEVFRFLGIDETFEPARHSELVNPYRENRFPRAWRFMMKHRLWRRLGPLREPVVRLFVRDDVRKPPLDPSVHHRLAAAFAEDNAALGAWLGRDLAGWSEERSGAPGG